MNLNLLSRVVSFLCAIACVASVATVAGAQAPAVDLTQANSAQTDVVALNSKGPAVLRAQVLLDQAGFSPGEIDALYGRNLRAAIRGFQAARQLPVQDEIGPDMWAKLDSDNAQVLISYEILPEDVAGPFQRIPTDMMGKAKLESLGYESPLELLGEKFHVSPKVLALLNKDKVFDRPGERILVPNVTVAMLDPVGRKAASVVVRKSDMTVSALDESGMVLAQFPASAGSAHDPLPIGKWKINGVAKNPPFHYNPKLFWDANPGHSKAKIAPGPNNPVGPVWIDLSKDHYGIHGTPEPSKVGHTQSHGCIRLTNWDAVRLANMVGPGTPIALVE
jgi:lipoprotein-anchoring transpeptidase ErfK/SrfK